MAEHNDSNSALDFPPVFNAASAFIDRHLAEGRADRVAIRTTDEQVVTYGQLTERVNRCGRLLLERGLQPGDRVLLVVADTPAFFYVFWGAVKAGIIPVPLNTLLRAADFAWIIDDSAARGLIFSSIFETEVLSALQLARLRPDVVLAAEGSDQAVLARLADVPPDLALAPRAPNDDCFWLYSSGSTGRPKGTIHAQRSMVVTSQHYGVGILGLTEEDCCYSAAKLFFAYGFGNAMTFPLWVGGTALLDAGRPLPGASLGYIERFRPSVFFGVPTLYAAQIQALASSAPDLSSLRACVSAGEALPGALFDRWRELTSVVVLDGIGSTEALHIFISNRLDDARPNTSGRLVPGYAARIVGEDGLEVPPNEAGQLWIRGDSTARGYWNNPERTAQTMVDGWLRTGDTYVRDSDARFVYQGRSDDMIKVSGQWCSPFEIEAQLASHPLVLEAAVVGRTDPSGLLKPAAFVVLTDPDQATDALRQTLLDHCKASLLPHKTPRWLSFVNELPKTATGKVRRFLLREG